MKIVGERRILLGVLSYILIFGIAYSLYLGRGFKFTEETKQYIINLKSWKYPWTQLPGFKFTDEAEYYTIARNIAFTYQRSLDGVNPSAYHCPGYPFFLAIFVYFGAGVTFLRFLNFAGLALSTYLLYRILKKEVAGPAGIIGALLVLCYPVLFYTAGTLYPQTIATTILMGILYLTAEILRSAQNDKEGARGNDRWEGVKFFPYIIGGLFGVLILFLPAVFPLFFVFLLWLWLAGRKRFKGVAIIGLTAVMLVGLWSLRNYFVFKSFVFVDSNSGLALLVGNNENTTPNAGTNVDISRHVNESARLGLNEVEEDKFFRQEALEFMRNNKARAVKLYFLKFLNYFNYRNELGTKAEAALWKDVLMLVTWGPLLMLFLVRLFLVGRLKVGRFEGLLILLYFASAFVHALFQTRIRYRLPFDFLLIMVVAMFLGKILRLPRPSGSQ